MKLKPLTSVCLLLFPFLGFSQSYPVEGLWKGAFIRSGNSIQLLEVQIFSQRDTLLSTLKVEDWPYYDAITQTLQQEREVFLLRTPYGDAKMYYDTIYQEMIGTIDEGTPPINVHLKRMVKDKQLPITMEEMTFNNNGFQFEGNLYYPQSTGSTIPCIVIVSGRGCNPRSSTEELASFFARQGMAAVAFDERGSENTNFDCNQSTQELETADLVQVFKKLKNFKKNFLNQFGVFTNSAGAWTADAASLQFPLDFMIQYVGPTTSIRQQQFDGLKAFAETGEFDRQYLNEAIRYTELLYSEKVNDTTYKEIESLLEKAKQHGWIDWLDDSDIPVSKEKFNELWVQRFQFDPTKALQHFKGPLLCIFGEEDPIVPYQIQAKRLDSICETVGKTNYSIKIVKEGTHGLNQSFRVRSFSYNSTLKSSPYYYKFYRAGVFPLIYATDFLKKYKFIKE